MKYTVYAEFTTCYSAEIEAKSNEEALDIVDGMAITDFKPDSFEDVLCEFKIIKAVNHTTGKEVEF